MRNPRRDMAITSLAGPVANLLMAIGWAVIAKIGFYANDWLGVPLIYMGLAGVQINIILGVLNCLPIPPLDGGRALYNILPGKLAWNFYKLEPYGFLILLLLMFSGILSSILAPIIYFLITGIARVFGLN